MGSLELRSGVDGRSLLLRNHLGVTYRFDPAAQTFEPSSEWGAASGDVAHGDRQRPDPSITTHQTVVSPRTGQVLSLTASGRRKSLMPFVAQGEKPPFFHQVGAEPKLELPFGSKVSALRACWSADERFVVYTDLLMQSVVIIER